ncbi:MAG: hypothetical protein K6343_06290 [Caldisericaceae bacterium]
MVYAIFNIQLLLVVAKFLIENIAKYELRIVLLLIAFLFLLLFFYLSFKYDFTPVSFLFGSFIISSIFHFNIWLNVLSFLSLYFYLIDKLKRNGIFNKKMYFYLSFVPLFGLLNIDILPFLKINFSQTFVSIASFLFTPIPKEELHTNLQNSPNNLGGIINEQVEVKNLSFTNIIAIVFALFILIGLLVFLYFVVKANFNKVKILQPKRNSLKQVLIFLSILPTIILMLLTLTTYNISFQSFNIDQSNFIYPFVLLILVYGFVLFIMNLYARKHESNYSKFYNSNFKVSLIISFFLILFLVIFSLLFYHIKNRDFLIIFALTILTVLGFVALAFYLYKLNGEILVPLTGDAFKDKLQTLSKKYKEFGVKYLAMISSKKEFIEYLYFLSVLTLIKRGFNYSESVTPKEFLNSIKNYLTSENFSKLVDAFYFVEYSGCEIDSVLFNQLKTNSIKMLEELENVKAN